MSKNYNNETNKSNTLLTVSITLNVVLLILVVIFGIKAFDNNSNNKTSSSKNDSKVEATTSKTDDATTASSEDETVEGETTQATDETVEGETTQATDETSSEETSSEDETVDPALLGTTATTDLSDDDIKAASKAVETYYNANSVDDYINGIPTEFKSAIMKCYGVDESKLKEYVQDMLDDLDKQYTEDYSVNLSDCTYDITVGKSTAIEADKVNNTTGEMREEWKDNNLKDITSMITFNVSYVLKDKSGKEIENVKDTDGLSNTVYCYDGKWYSIDVLYMVDYAASTTEVSSSDGTLDLTQ